MILCRKTDEIRRQIALARRQLDIIGGGDKTYFETYADVVQLHAATLSIITSIQYQWGRQRALHPDEAFDGSEEE